MNHPNSILKFSLGLNSLWFDVDSQHIHLEQGLDFVGSKVSVMVLLMSLRLKR